MIVTGKNPATIEQARANLRGIAEVVSSDSGDGAEIEALFARVAGQHGGLDVLFLNARILRRGTIATLSESLRSLRGPRHPSWRSTGFA